MVKGGVRATPGYGATEVCPKLLRGMTGLGLVAQAKPSGPNAPVTTLASLGLSWQVISMLTGHKNPEMIDHYNRPGKDQFAEGMRKYDNHLRLVS